MQKTAYELRISDWSSDVCSSDLILLAFVTGIEAVAHRRLFSRAIDPLAGAESAATKVDLRYLQHTLEQLVVFLPGLFGLAYYCNGPRSVHAVTATAILWVIGSCACWIGFPQLGRASFGARVCQ